MLRTYAQLCRLPAVFTAIADIVMGYFVRQESPGVTQPGRFIAVIFTSIGLYLAGMVLNDLFDREIDARERPHRPIPSGRISLSRAALFASGLIVMGLVASHFAGFQSVLVALLLLGNVFLYDGWAKKTPLGPVVMGGCRFLNVLLGGSVHAVDFQDVFTSELVIVATAMWIYVSGVTWFARKEAEQSGRGVLIFGQAVINLGLVLLAAWIAPQLHEFWTRFDLWVKHPGVEAWRPLAILGVIAVVVNRRALAAISDPRPAMVQSAVRIMLLSIITIDATLIYTALGDAGIPIAVATVALWIPSFLLGKWMTMT